MRKKSHISLAGYLIRELGLQELAEHKKAFYLGSILPDFNPWMVKSPHEFDVTFEKMQASINRLIEEGKEQKYNARAFWRHLGMIIHYLADYFTFPHNSTYDGNLKDHCVYEGDMKLHLREYVQTLEAKKIFQKQWKDIKNIENTEELFAYIEQEHQAYLAEKHTVFNDCRWILEMCSAVTMVIIRMVNEEFAAFLLQEYYQVA